jgi:hypothetical protein
VGSVGKWGVCGGKLPGQGEVIDCTVQSPTWHKKTVLVGQALNCPPVLQPTKLGLKDMEHFFWVTWL